MDNRKLHVMALATALLLPSALKAYDPPTMGWSSWNTYRVNISTDIICRQADAMASTGLKQAGYTYINIDDGFFGGRDETGRLYTHPDRFPNGLKPVVDYIHSLGFKAGIYSDAGHNTCGNYWDKDEAGVGVGFYGHDDQDARFYFEEMGFDFIKIDFCGGDAKQNTEQLSLDERERYTAIRKAIDAVGRNDVRINVCRWAFPGTWVHSIGSSWRIAGDIGANWASVKRIINANNYLSAYAGEGHYNDMDMLEIGRGLSAAEERTHFGMWCIMSSPLLIGCDMTKIPASSLELISNPELIAINQDALGLQARIVATGTDGLAVYAKDVRTLHGKTRAVAIYNPSNNVQTYTLNMSDVDLSGNIKVRDLISRTDMPSVTNGAMTITLKAHDTAVLLLEGEKRLERTLYEAEWAWLERFQQLGINSSLGHAVYTTDSNCSGGARVGWLGNHAENYMEWRDVWSREGGIYELNVECLQWKNRSIELSVNGGEAQTLNFEATNIAGRGRSKTIQVVLAPGDNTIRIANPQSWAPDIDCMTLKAVNTGTGINDIPAPNGTRCKIAKVLCRNGRLRLPKGGDFAVWSTDGICHATASGSTELNVKPGVYLLLPIHK
ncbi:MAG: alpha-galactosidase [Paraprevotella sp.]|nr:alpha-galactosidase [Paraprevotella sp.]